MSQSERFRFRQADEDREVRQAEARVGQPDQLQEVIANAICNNIINPCSSNYAQLLYSHSDFKL